MIYGRVLCPTVIVRDQVDDDGITRPSLYASDGRVSKLGETLRKRACGRFEIRLTCEPQLPWWTITVSRSDGKIGAACLSYFESGYTLASCVHRYEAATEEDLAIAISDTTFPCDHGRPSLW